MLSPIGRNAQACCDFYGIPLVNFGTVSKRLAWTVFHRNSSQSDADKIRTIKELLSEAGLVALSSFDASRVDFTAHSNLVFLIVFYLYVLRSHNKYILDHTNHSCGDGA